MSRHDPANTGYSNTTGPERPSTIWRYETGGTHTSSPAVVNNKVYVGAWDNNIYCLDSLTGSPIWVYTTADIIVSSPAAVDEKVYVGSKDDYIYCLDGNNGSLVWKYQTGDGVCSSPTVVGGKVYVGSNDGYCYCLDANNGGLIWRYQTRGHIVCSPAVVDGRTYLGSWDEYIYCLDANNGSLIWTSYAGHIEYPSPSISEGKVYVGSRSWFDETWHDYVSCFNASEGSLIWRFDSGGAVGSPAVAYGRVYIGSLDGHVYCLDTNTGSLIWNYRTVYPIGPASGPAVADGKLYIGCYDGYIYCLDADSGGLIWIHPTNDWQLFSPAVVDGKLYIGSYNSYYGYVYCIGEGSPLIDGEPPIVMRVDYSPKTPNHTDSVVVVSELWDLSGISSVILHYEAGSGWKPINMLHFAGTTYNATIPAQSAETQVNFYIESIDNMGNVARSSIFTFTVVGLSDAGTDFTTDSDDFRSNGFKGPLTIAGILAALMFVLVGLAFGILRGKGSQIKPIVEPEVFPTYEEDAMPEAPVSEDIAPETVEREMPEPPTPSEPVCSYCKHVNPVGAEFCIRCGRYIGEVSI